MSFLDSVLSSIETGKPSPIPQVSSTVSPPVTSSTVRTEVRKTSLGPRNAPPTMERKPLTQGIKRKADESLPRSSKLAPPAPFRPTATKPAIPAAGRARPSAPTAAVASASTSRSSTPQRSAQVSSKPPPKGSFADLMAKAKALQEKTPTQVGMFKHQAAAKEKLSKVERKKRATEAQTKEKDSRSAKKPGATATAAGSAKPGATKPVKKREPEELSYKGTSRPTPRPAQPEYRGTAGLPAKRNPNELRAQSRSKRSRMDEYLGTDEEDEGDYADDYDDYDSGSSDMEAGYDAMEEEEAAALAAARREDEEEWNAEQAAKQAKMERLKKLNALAARR
ncbi:hypothetical protein BO86DRAFT_352729 [Aspergillus japonicus CBS 114.51]|uniref:SPT2 chromatin protein n=2 Tax=Aspergillus TaxID=5052 RepID=A0A2V5IDE3_ASPV1|nr:hypothetical protein BO86DRAFT_352729 [Aspergillus japonicus CBS 114.51]PYI21987.1 hypothetical protein BO99DRAFT_379012 [Aspergillus violaceofuscus CBS 115571]RAH86411.1 hypothetical protein BO86DRAFT_352729 [Aspergillus japonicus CBS 114.51]